MMAANRGLRDLAKNSCHRSHYHDGRSSAANSTVKRVIIFQGVSPSKMWTSVDDEPFVRWGTIVFMSLLTAHRSHENGHRPSLNFSVLFRPTMEIPGFC